MRPRGQRGASRIDVHVGGCGIAVACASDGGDAAGFDDDGVSVENGVRNIPGQHQANVTDDNLP